MDPPRNPWSIDRLAGGSSGGAAAALAAGFAFGAIGTDSGGSIRSPASLCGVVGLAPTPGLVSRHGLVLGSASLDRVGPMARTVEDCARLLSIMVGADPFDTQSAHRVVPDFEGSLKDTLHGRRIGVLRDYMDVSAPVLQRLMAAAQVLRDHGAVLIEVVIPDLEALNANAMCVFASEMADRHRDLMQDRAGDIHPEVLTRLLQGRSVSAMAYHEAMSAREPSTRAFCGEVFAAIDALMLPASPTIAPLAIDVLADGAMPHPSQAVDPGRYTRAFNYLGLPAMALPAGFDPAGLPIGMQLVGRPFDDALLLRKH